VAVVDADLRTLAATRRDAEVELVEVRRRGRELLLLEDELLAAIELRSRRIDDVLDERLRAVAGDRSGAEPDRPPSHLDHAGEPRPATAGNATSGRAPEGRDVTAR
jgi:hypothetical protein